MSDKRQSASGKNAVHEAYVDLLQPLAREVGDVAGELVVRVLQPIRALIWGYDKIVQNFGPALKKALKRVPAERLIEPNPAVAVPVFLSLAYTGHDDPIRTMFANLLASSMDSKTAKLAHPSFVSILRELVPDEARVLRALQPNIMHRTQIRVEYGMHGGSTMTSTLDLLRDECGLENPDVLDAYLTNLARTSLIEVDHREDIFLMESLDSDSVERIVLLASDSVSHSNAIGKASGLEGSIRQCERIDRDKGWAKMPLRCSFTQVVSLTSFGAMFHQACIEE